MKNSFHPKIYPIVTRERQQAYEYAALQAGNADNTPSICGYYGRACRKMDDPEGADRCLCHGCALKEYCFTVERSAR